MPTIAWWVFVTDAHKKPLVLPATVSVTQGHATEDHGTSHGARCTWVGGCDGADGAYSSCIVVEDIVDHRRLAASLINAWSFPTTIG